LRELIAVSGGWSEDVAAVLLSVRRLPVPRAVISAAVGRCLPYGLSRRGTAELLAERGITAASRAEEKWLNDPF
jgi:hypothetical protein